MRHRMGVSSYWGRSDCWGGGFRESWLFSGDLAYSRLHGTYWSESWLRGFDLSSVYGRGRECSILRSTQS